MTDEDIVIGVRGDLSGGRAIEQNLQNIAKQGDRAKGSVGALERELQALGNAFRGVLGGLGAREIIRMSDNFTLLRERVKLSTQSAGEFQAAFQGLRRVSQETGASLNATVDVFQRLSFVRNEIGATVADMVEFTDTVSKLGITSGASTDAMRAGLLQLGQALSAGVVRAEEFNSVVENLPAVAKAVADQFGVTTGALRQLVLEGVVASQDFYSAVLNASQEVEAAYAQMPMTIGRAFNALYGDFEAFIGASSQASGAATVVIGVIDTLRVAVYGLGQGFDILVTTIGTNMALMVEAIESAVNRSINNINGLIELINRLPGVNIGTMGNVDWNGVTASDIIRENNAQIGSILSKKGPQATVFDRMAGPPDLGSSATEQRKLTQDYAAMARGISEGNKGRKEGKKLQDELTQAIKNSMTQEQKLGAEIANLERLKGFAKTTAEVDALNAGIRNTQKELDDLRLKAELDGPIAKAFGRLTDTVDDGLRDAFTTTFTETEGGWDKMLEGLKSSFKRFLAELAYEALARPIVVSVLSQVGSSMGLSGGAVSNVLGTANSAGGTSSLGSLGSIGSSLLNGGLYSSTLGGFGYKVGSLLGGGGMGPSTAGFIGSKAFGNLGYGALGGLGASLLGLGSKNQMVNMATGTVGSLIGGAFGPIGAVAGGFLGTALGGLFGGGIKRETLGATLTAQNGRFGYTANSSKKGAADWGKQVADSINSIADALGATLVGTLGSVETNIGSKDKKTVVGHSIKTSGKAGDVNSILRYVYDRGYVQDANPELLGVARRSLAMGSGASQAVSDIGLAKQILGIDDDTERALKEIDKQFEQMRERAIALGLPLDKITDVLGKQKDAAIGAIKAMEAGFSSLEEMTASFKAFLDSQALGSNSSLSPLQKLGLAQSNYDTLLGKAQGGDSSVTKELLAAASTVIDVGRQVFASSQGFADLEAIIRTDLKDIAKGLGIPGYATGTDHARSGLAWVGEQGPELVRFRGGEQVYNATQSQGMAREGARMNMQMIALLSEIAESNKKQFAELRALAKAKNMDRAQQKVTA